MAYRNSESCDSHSLAAATARCSDCGGRVCDGCVDFSATGRRCEPCARGRAARRKRRARLVALSLVALAFLASFSTGLVLGFAGAEQDARRPRLAIPGG